MRRLNVSTVVTGTGGGKLEALNSEGQVLIIGIVDQKAVVDGLLQALGFITLRHKRTSISGGGTFLNTGSLGQSFVVGLDVVNDDSPFSVDVDGSQRLDVGSLGGAQVGFLDNFLQSVDRVISIGQDIFVHLLHGIVVVFDGLLDLVGGVFRILQTPGFGVVLGTHRFVVRLRSMMRSMVRSGVVGKRGVMGGGVVGSIGSGMMNWSIGIVVGSGGIGVGMVGSRAVGHWCVAIRGGGGSVSMSMMGQWVVWCGCGCGGSGDQS